MTIEELDEWQGITSEMIQAWLLANGWKQVEQMAYQLDAPPVRTGWLFRRGDETVGTGADISYVLANLSRLSCKTPQALLREINPRMRKGVPSKAALRAHRGLWLRSLGKENIATILSRQLEEFPSPRDDESFFWPCDDNYNKTRWPTDAQGNML